MNKKFIFLIFLIIVGILGFIFFQTRNNTSSQPEYNAKRTSQNITNETNVTDNSNNEKIENNTVNNESTEDNNQKSENTTEKDNSKEETKKPKKETEIASFTTKIYTKDSGRQNNLTLACSSLNNTTVNNGQTFSFSKTVGRATSRKGYKKADVFRNGDVVEALGGGLCQVSTTLYNAVLKVPDLKVTERHPHSNKVPYIKSGKDAAVSFGAQDFKFVNNTGNTIKIKASNTKNNVTIKLYKLE